MTPARSRRWGVIRWRAALNGGRIEVATRSGNTSTPDETWSPWSKPYTNADGRADGEPERALPAVAADDDARHGSASPVLTSVTAAYLPRNLRPVAVRRSPCTRPAPCSSVRSPPASRRSPATGQHRRRPAAERAAGDARPASAPPLGRRLYQKGLQTFVWKAEDGNDDRLQYDVSYRREGETAWRVLQRGAWDPIFVWDTTSVPDGTYVVKITATDAPSNAPGNALSGELESASFDIDNTPPRVEIQPPARSRRAHVHHLHRSRRAVRRPARRVLARRQPLAPGAPQGRDPGFTARGVRGGARRRRTPAAT